MSEEWKKERDFYIGEHGGFNWHILRMRHSGHLCGYVELPKGHPKYGKNRYEDHFDLTVHGGITYCDFSEDKSKFIIGFDCSHCDDLRPYDGFRFENSVYRNKDYVLSEIKSLIEQLKGN